MDKTFLIEVTQYDIYAGVQLDPGQCPVGRSVKRATGAVSVSAGLTSITWVTPNGRMYDAKTPVGVGELMANFDISRHSIQPFKFELKDIKPV
jgi:hypothetical protein